MLLRGTIVQGLHGKFEPSKAQYSTPNFFDQLFLIRVYWNPKSRQGPGPLGALSAVAPLPLVRPAGLPWFWGIERGDGSGSALPSRQWYGGLTCLKFLAAPLLLFPNCPKISSVKSRHQDLRAYCPNILWLQENSLVSQHYCIHLHLIGYKMQKEYIILLG